MKNKYILLFLIGLLIPSFVFAHEANTKVDVDVFYKEQDDFYDTLMTALNELSNETETMGRFIVRVHSHNESISKKAYKYASYENSNELLIFVGNRISLGFASKKNISGSESAVSTLYNYYKKKLKDDILYEYKISYDSIIEDIANGYYDSYLDSVPSTEEVVTSPSDTYSDFDSTDMKDLLKGAKDFIKENKMMQNIIYPVIFLIVFSIIVNTLKNSINKGR